MSNLFSLTRWRRIVQGGFLVLGLQLLASGSAWAACNVELYSTLANGQDRLKANCDTGISITSITWYKDGVAIVGSTSDFSGGPNPGGSIFYALPLAVGCADALAHTYTAKGNNGAVPSGAGATIACSANIKNVTLTVGANGTATCPSTVVSGNQAVCTINPAATYTPQVGGTCPAGSLSGSTYTSGAITQDCTIAVTFNAPNANPGPWTVSTTTTGNGTLTCQSYSVAHNGTTTCTPNPAVSGITYTPGTTCSGSPNAFGFNVGPVTGNCNVQANFPSTQAGPFTVTGVANPTAGGSVSCNPSSVNSGNTTTCTITTNTGYTLTGASSDTCGGSLSGSAYTTGSVTSACTVTATFTGGGGSTSGGSAQCSSFPGFGSSGNDRFWDLSVYAGRVFPSPTDYLHASGEYGTAVQFIARSDIFPNGLYLNLIEQHGNAPGKEAVLSECAHSFSQDSQGRGGPVGGAQACRIPLYAQDGQFQASFNGSGFRVCVLQPMQTYYINFRDYNTPKGEVLTQFGTSGR